MDEESTLSSMNEELAWGHVPIYVGSVANPTPAKQNQEENYYEAMLWVCWNGSHLHESALDIWPIPGNTSCEAL